MASRSSAASARVGRRAPVEEFGERFTPLVFDVTDEAAVAAGARRVATALANSSLFGLVNNAGIAVSGPLLYLAIDDFKHQFAVNLTGQLIVTQAFAPLLGADRARQGSPGRIVMMSSIAGRNGCRFWAPTRRRSLHSRACRNRYAES